MRNLDIINSFLVNQGWKKTGENNRFFIFSPPVDLGFADDFEFFVFKEVGDKRYEKTIDKYIYDLSDIYDKNFDDIMNIINDLSDQNLMDKKLIGVEVRGRYDGIAYRKDEEGKRYSKVYKQPISENQLCKYGKIYTVDKNMNIISQIDEE